MPNSLMDAIEASVSKLNNNQIQWWAYKLGISFNPDETKQAQEIICSRKTQNGYHSIKTL